MSGQFDYNSDDSPPELSGNAAFVVVCKYDPDAGENKAKFTIIPNVKCETIAEREGLEPSTARFHYVLDGTGEPDWPSQFEEIFALIENKGKSRNKEDAARRAARRKRYVVMPEDRLCVLVFQDAKSSSDYQIYFDGFAESPEVHVGPSGQSVTFTASSVGIRLWDTPITDRMERNARIPNLETVAFDDQILVENTVVFNPDGKPNCTPDGSDSSFFADSEAAEPFKRQDFPIFLEPGIKENPSPLTFWTIEKVARYLMVRGNSEEKYVANPDFSTLKDLLNSRRPKDDQEYFNPDDKDTYQENAVVVTEYDVTGKRWPEALQSLVSHYGFGSKYEIGTDENGEPDNIIDLYRKDGTGISDPKDIYFQQTGQALDPAKTNTQEFNVTRDYKNTYNAVIVDTKPELWEVSIILAPGFQPASGDEAPTSRTSYTKANLDQASSTTLNKYRLYIADETGAGHLKIEAKVGDTAATEWEKFPFLFAKIFPIRKNDQGDTVVGHSYRLRPGKPKLISVGEDRRPLETRLDISTDFAGEAPYLWDGTGTWQPVTSGWTLLKDRLGIYINCDDPGAWKTCQYTGPNGQVLSPVVDGIASQSNPDPAENSTTKRFYLMLTTVIESDKRPVKLVEKRASSALKFNRTLYSHSKETFAKKTLSANSKYNIDPEHNVIIDNTDLIKAYAAQQQQAHENPQIAGAVMIPYLDRGYQIGDAIKSVAGRDLSLQINSGVEQGESARYPLVVGRTFRFHPVQHTELQLSDHRADAR